MSVKSDYKQMVNYMATNIRLLLNHKGRDCDALLSALGMTRWDGILLSWVAVNRGALVDAGRLQAPKPPCFDVVYVNTTHFSSARVLASQLAGHCLADTAASSVPMFAS